MRSGAVTALLVVLGACTARLPHPTYSAQVTTALTAADYPPPPARVEQVPPQPDPAAVWIDGEWTWNGRKWRWKPGRWVLPPAGATFSLWTTVRDAAGTLFVAPGTWRNAEGKDVAEPEALAYGAATSGAVWSAEGEAEPDGPSAHPGPPAPPSIDGGS